MKGQGKGSVNYNSGNSKHRTVIEGPTVFNQYVCMHYGLCFYIINGLLYGLNFSTYMYMPLFQKETWQINSKKKKHTLLNKKLKKVIATFYLTILTFFHRTVRYKLAILT